MGLCGLAHVPCGSVCLCHTDCEALRWCSHLGPCRLPGTPAPDNLYSETGIAVRAAPALLLPASPVGIRPCPRGPLVQQCFLWALYWVSLLYLIWCFSAVAGLEGVFRSFTFNVNVAMVGFKSTICYLFSVFPMCSLFPFPLFLPPFGWSHVVQFSFPSSAGSFAASLCRVPDVLASVLAARVLH